jgi:DNA-binding transcriptional LysR family regulator
MGEREELIDAMLRGSVDMGLDWGPITRAGVVTAVLLEEPFVIVAAPHHPLASNTVVSREEFARAPFLGLQFGVRTPGFSETAMNEAGLRPNIIMRLPSTDAVKRLAEAGLGVGCMGRIAAERELATGRLCSLNVEGFSLKQPLLVFRPQGPLRTRAVANFYQFLFQHPRIPR